MTRPIRSASVLMPCYQGIEFLDRVLESLSRQRWQYPWDVHVIDSGSTDGTLECLLRWQQRFPVPLHVRTIHNLEFDHGDTRNQLAADSAGDLLVFLTQDAIPSHDDWLAGLARNFDDPQVGAAYSRNVPRDDALPLTRVFCRDDPGYAEEGTQTELPDPAEYALMDAHQKRALYNFQDVASAIRRELWALCPFPRTNMGEDVLMARALLEAGFTTVYDAHASVDHSHDYGPEQLRARAEVDARFNAEWLDRVCIAEDVDPASMVPALVEADLEAAAILDLGVDPESLRQEAQVLRLAALQGLYDGSRAERRFPPNRLRRRLELDLLFVVPGFPHEDGGELGWRVMELVYELKARGHRVTVLTAAPLGEGQVPFSLEELEMDSIRLLRMARPFEVTDLRATFLEPEVERVLDEVLAAERFDVVHFHHLQRLSAGLVDVARRHGIGTVVSAVDPWGVCPRGRLLQPSGVACEGLQGAGCAPCLRGESTRRIARAAKAGWDRPLLSERLALRLKGKPLDPQREILRERERVLPAGYAAADLCLVPSRSLRARYLATGAFEPRALVYTPLGVPALEERPSPGDGESQALRVGFVSLPGMESDLELLLDARQRLQAGSLRVRVFADPASLQLPPELQGVEVLGPLVLERAATLAQEVDVLVAPALAPGSAVLPILDALAGGVPVITSRGAEEAECVRDGENGLLIQRGQVEELATALNRLVESPDLLRRLTEAARPLKTLEAYASELTFRYQALAGVHRRGLPPSRELLVADGAGAERAGDTQEQGVGWLLVRFGGRASYPLEGFPSGPVSLLVEQYVLAAEEDTLLAGRVLVDGEPVGYLEPLEPQEEVLEDQHTRTRLHFDLPEGARELAFEPGLGVPDHRLALRLCRVALARRFGNDTPEELG